MKKEQGVDEITKKQVNVIKGGMFEEQLWQCIGFIFLTLVLIGVFTGKGLEWGGGGLSLVAGSITLCALPFCVLFSVLSKRHTRSDHASIYQGSLNDLVKEIYIHGFTLNNKIGEFYVFRTHNLFFKGTMLVRDNKENCELFGDHPKRLHNKSAKRERR
jgi:hypothetical protein